MGAVFARDRLLGSVAVCALLASAGAAEAGGLAVREQSAIFQGLSFAGDAAGGALSSSFWNPAAISEAGWGLQSESALSAILGSSEVTPRAGTTFPSPGGPVGAPPSFLNEAEDIGRPALVAASYYAYRLSPDLVLGLAINAPFGLSTEADENWGGQYHGRSGKIFTINVNPMLSYNLAPNLSVGVGVQIQYGQIVFKGNPNLAPGHPNAGFDVDDIGFGATAGLLWKPAPGTTIGLGFRSAIEHDFEGDFFVVGGQLNLPVFPFALPFTDVGLEGSVMLPEMVTLSLRQALSPSTRLLASVEWTNWSRLGTVTFNATSTGGAPPLRPIAPGDAVSTFEFNWHDGWFFALGGEYDYSPSLTLRAGVAYEISPIHNANERFSLITDSDRIWLSAGLSYRLSERLAVDLAYSHIFFEDASIDRATNTSGAPLALVADVEQSADIISAGLRIKWGGEAPLK